MSSIEALFSAASKARLSAYAPYSGFAVGAALATDSGAIFSGTNVENAAYPVGTCAEAAAIAAMVVAGQRRIAEILIIGEGDALVTSSPALAASVCANSPAKTPRSTLPEPQAFAQPLHLERFCRRLSAQA